VVCPKVELAHVGRDVQERAVAVEIYQLVTEVRD